MAKKIWIVLIALVVLSIVGPAIVNLTKLGVAVVVFGLITFLYQRGNRGRRSASDQNERRTS